MLAATVANTTRRSEKDRVYVVDDFTPSEPVEEPTDREVADAAKARMNAIFEGMGG